MDAKPCVAGAATSPREHLNDPQPEPVEGRTTPPLPFTRGSQPPYTRSATATIFGLPASNGSPKKPPSRRSSRKPALSSISSSS